MPESTMLRYRIDEDLKEEAEAVFKSMGLSPQSAIKLFYRQTVIRKKLPFQPVAEDPFYSEENQRILLESVKQLIEGKGTSHELIEA